MSEQWMPVWGWPYEVSDLGRVRRTGRARSAQVGRILKGCADKDGYILVVLSSKNVTETRKVHHLVLEAFIGRRPTSDHECGHSDGNPANNRLGNLSWKTSKQNKADKILHGTHGVTLSEFDAAGIKQMREFGCTYDFIAATYSTSKSAVSHICKNRVWRHL